MSLIAVESADGACSIARVDGEQFELRQCAQSRDSLSWLMRQFDELDAGPALRGIACCTGPGGFTGVRVAVGFAQGLGLARRLPVLGVASLDALAQASLALDGEARQRWVALDARMGELYAARYRLHQDGRIDRDGELMLMAPETLHARLDPDACLLGPGFAAYPELFGDQYLPGLALDAAAVAARARLIPVADWPAAAQLQPIYLRNKVARTLVERGKA